MYLTCIRLVITVKSYETRPRTTVYGAHYSDTLHRTVIRPVPDFGEAYGIRIVSALDIEHEDGHARFFGSVFFVRRLYRRRGCLW